MSEGPRLYDHKPKKAQLKQFQQKVKDIPSTSSSAAVASYTMGPPPPPPQPPKESFARRYKFLWPLLLAVNFTVGAYLFMRTKKKDTNGTEEDVDSSPHVSTTAVTTQVTENTLPAPPIVTQHLKSSEPIPESQQRELFKYMLKEKRKIKPKDPEEKRRLDEEKAILKQFIRAKSIPQL
ncbi:3-epi-6-deoxocathasterone 23-monooxygenase-like [Hibiscus syriacus]|uniref:3-epi-6-deoxocathasterone 23-monooxygenase-like n=1 Tax=Hibiscus syriacus TaxID=106335 RepID=A0A6A2ZWT6_HIBSY|nr:uncharacterized protein LOC120137518 [Hibiscus syriacus]KAE8696400.1 3-epi-6-deoxocathasterone 23-monooxygenase-like [Hibiscus syriacus]